ncbi:hypothetical protein [Microseira wollei]|uniref:hypothetical protein n=1 Tax=Microseira wollei TaxID=467598 RepID=UPI001CFCEF0D|nr:hypothetical protein [Microseira wollei]
MLELIVFAVQLLGISGLARLYVALNITSLVSLFYHDIHLAIKLTGNILATPHASFPCLFYGKISSKMQSSPPALYPTTDLGYQIQWGTYGE